MFLLMKSEYFDMRKDTKATGRRTRRERINWVVTVDPHLNPMICTVRWTFGFFKQSADLAGPTINRKSIKTFTLGQAKFW